MFYKFNYHKQGRIDELIICIILNCVVSLINKIISNSFQSLYILKHSFSSYVTFTSMWYIINFCCGITWQSIVISGDTFRIPDSIMGLTFLAAGMSVPEAVSSVIVANQGNFLLFVFWLIDIVLTGISTN